MKRIRPDSGQNPEAVAATGLVRFFVVPAKGFVKVTVGNRPPVRIFSTVAFMHWSIAVDCGSL